MKNVLRALAVVALLAVIAANGILWLDLHEIKAHQRIQHLEASDQLRRIRDDLDEIDSQVRWVRHAIDRLSARKNVEPGDKPAP